MVQIAGLASRSCDEASGNLRYVENTPTGGRTPRTTGISGCKYLLAANQQSDNVVVFKIDSSQSLDYDGTLEVPSPVCVKFLPLGK
jgi:6-phosphogluconolactonase